MGLSGAPTESVIRLGVFGSAMDPPHLGHQALIACAVEQLGLERVHIIPTGQAWHKPRLLSAPQHRLAMTRLAFDHLPHAVVDERELQRQGPSYTVDTLRELQQIYPKAELYLLLGQDQWEALPSWNHWTDVVEMAKIAVAKRQSDDNSPLFLPNHPAVRRFSEHRFVALHMPREPVSATQLRALWANGQAISAWVGQPVADYIRRHQLYLTASNDTTS